jgi:creatinine amidohydrolase
VQLDELTEEEVRERRPRVAVLALGATEGHSRHLPLGTDTYIVGELARRVGERYPAAVVLPTLPYGMSWAYEDAPVTITLSPETLTEVVVEIVESLLRHGLDRVLVLNGHDGNVGPIEAAARRVRRRHGVAMAALQQWWLLLPTLVPSDTFSTVAGNGGHAGEPETAIALAAVPRLVRMDRARPPRTAPRTGTLYGPGIQVFGMVSEHHLQGDFLDPSHARAEAGDRALDALADHVAAFLREAEACDWAFGVEQGGDPGSR